jgi:hypothetical protein
MKKERNEFICLFKTGKLYELDMVGDALQKQRIPFFKQVETSSGLRFAMPFQPSMGPGTWYVILVPENAFGDAKKILEDLPIEVSTNPDIWHFGTSDRVKSGWRFYVWIVLGLTFFSLVIYLYELLK